MPGLESGSAGIDQLLPWSDFIKEHCSGLIEVEKVTVENKPTVTFQFLTNERWVMQDAVLFIAY